MLRRLLILAIAALPAACTVNPVTGARELALVSPADEIAIGEAQYLPSRQMQGGDYVLDPMLQDYVAGVGQRLAAVSDRALPYEFVVLNNSSPNAWALPGGKIAVNRGLLTELESEAELAAVLGHEIVHAAARHGALAMQRGMLLQGALLATAIASQRNNYSQLAVGAASIGAQLLNQRYSREAELEADRYGIEYMARAGYDPGAAVSLQQTFVRLSEGRAEGWLAGLFASHPPSSERVEQNRRLAAGLPGGGEVGLQSYQAATSELRAAQPAYRAYEQGRAALADSRLQEAEQLAADAVRLEPGEAHFYALQGDVDFAGDRLEAAIRHYDEAIARNDRFFYYPLQRGLARQRLGRLDAAEQDLQASIALLPSANAFYALGQIAERRGNRDAALQHYSQAADSSSAAGQAAQEAVVRLDLPQNPGNYLSLRTGLDARGQLIIEIGNPTGVDVENVVLAVRYADAQGVIRQLNRSLAGLEAGAVQRIDTGLGPFASADDYQVGIVQAGVVTR